MILGAQAAVVNQINIVLAAVVSHVQIIRRIAAILDVEISIPPRIAVAPVVSDSGKRIIVHVSCPQRVLSLRRIALPSCSLSARRCMC